MKRWQCPDCGAVGTCTDIACSPDGTTIYISFYNDTYDNLVLAKSTNSGSTWTVQTVDSAGNAASIPQWLLTALQSMLLTTTQAIQP